MIHALRQFGSINRSTLLSMLAGASLALMPVAAEAQEQPKWSAGFGVDLLGDPDDPYTGDVGFEASLWYSVTAKIDVGGRIGMLSFESDGLPPDDGPVLVPGEGDIVTLDLGARFYPGSGTKRVYPLLGAALVFPISDSFDGEPLETGGGTGITVDSDWDPDGVGFSAEVGIRWDVSPRVNVEAVATYMSLGVDSIRIVEVEPETVDESALESDLDNLSFGINVGFYF